jgi:hypothetical protein
MVFEEGIVRDGAPVMPLTVRKLGLPWMHCAAQAVNLVVEGGLEFDDAKSVVTRVRDLFRQASETHEGPPRKTEGSQKVPWVVADQGLRHALEFEAPDDGPLFRLEGG